MAFSHRELDDLRPEVDRVVTSFFGFNEPILVTAALNCIGKGYDRHKTIDKLCQILDEKQAKKFSDKLFSTLDDYKVSLKGKTRKRKDEYHDSVETKRLKVVEEITPVVPVVPEEDMGLLTKEKIAEMMQNAQKMIQQRKVDLNLQTPITSIPQDVHMNNALDKAKRAQELQARIQAKLASANLGSALAAFNQKTEPVGVDPQAPGYKPQPLVLDEKGQTIDAKTGEAITLTHVTPTLKANIRAKRREEFKAVIEKPPEEVSATSYFDPRVSIKGNQRGRRKFTFHEQGKYEKLASRLRTKAQLEKLQSDISKAAKKTGIASATKLATIQTADHSDDHIPDVEWWDSFIMTTNTYEDIDDNIDNLAIESITNLVEHPIQMNPPSESTKAVPLQVILTKKERKKLRRQNRNEAQKELQEKIRLGLLPPAEPKVRMANLMRVLGNEAIQDPTKVEAHVRAQMAKRQRCHEEANAARKLTPEQRREKKAKKLQEDTSLGLHVTVYRVRDLNNPARKFKIEANASQLYMTGIVVCYGDCNVVVVEGGPKQQKKFKRLMMHRIKWTDERAVKDEDSDSEEEEVKQNICECVWEGQVKNRSFGELKIKVCPSERYAREHFVKHGVEHYWNFAYSDSVLKTTIGDS